MQEDQFLFFKLEEHGNSGAMEAIRHGINYAESLRRKKSDQASSRTEKPSKKQRNWFMAIVDHAMLDTKPRLLASDHTGARLDAFTPCFTKDDFKLRAKALGFSFMHPVVCAIRDGTKDDAASAAVANLIETSAAAKLVDSSSDDDDSDSDSDDDDSEELGASELVNECQHWMSHAFQYPAMDHLDKRYAKEVIFLDSDFDVDFAAPDPDGRHTTGDTEGIIEMSSMFPPTPTNGGK